ncbi:MAG TPA: hypothetical protein VFG68_04130 [Fimbriiglobus sp.]|nr:hypothetical protein [Fimbriiglobus sp.]
MPVRPLFAAWMIVALGGVASAGADDPALVQKLKSAAKQYEQKKDAARGRALKEFDNQIAHLKTDRRLTPAARGDKVKEWTAARERFAETGRFPRDDQYANVELQYYLAVDRGFRPLTKLIDDVIADGVRTGKKETEAAGLKLREDIEQQLPGAGRITAPSVWRGTYTRSGAVIPYELHIGKRGASTFAGRVEDNAGAAGNWAFNVEGQTSGLSVEFVLTRSIRGKFKYFKLRGIVCDDRLIGTTQTRPGGKVVGVVVLRRGK